MCGITGFYSNKYNESDLIKMTQTLLHRGPDANKVYFDEINNIGLGHTRLSILDLSDNANQPMISHNGRYVMVYNGEVYNYRDIAAELKQIHQIDFKTSSDSEVILEAFSHYGVSFIEKLNGMFAIAIYDKELNELFLIRDRIGIKPLYYYKQGNDVMFASEIKAIKTVTSKLEINHNAVQLFLHLGFIPAPLSIYENIHKLESGHYLKITELTIEKMQYWSTLSAVSDKLITREKEAMVKFSDLLSSSIQYQLKSDVPFGVFLSGGIDSSLITAQASSISSVPINTFSIGFKENRFNESIYAEKVAKHLKTNHSEFIVSEKDAIEQVEYLIDVYDEPFADSSSIPTLLVSKLAKQKVSVCLSGEGGDELFLGYGAYKWAQRLNNPLVNTFKKPIAFILENSHSTYKRHSTYFKCTNKRGLRSHILSQEQYYFMYDKIDDVLTNDFKKKISGLDDVLIDFDKKIDNLKRKLNPMEKQSLFDLNFYLQEDLLTKVDRASMYYSLETRVPYLDHRIIEFALNLSPSLKYKNGISKYLLKEILYQYLPKEIFDRPKQGFTIPLASWLQNDMSYLISDYLNEKIVNRYGVINYIEVSNLLKRFYSGDIYLYNRIWLLIILHKFLEKNY